MSTRRQRSRGTPRKDKKRSLVRNVAGTFHLRDRVLADPNRVLSDVAWSYAPRNGNPMPVAECGHRHYGRCCSCGDGYCCY